ncbi:hypothetical protein DPMN_054041 [Dreissena polymorpha]|uniref:Uncharacterized protein n=1 Tax=Dreissena polymorpha TaxID=45954 RepID=A0A9D4HQV4_DREPO|nr:hypothetical protein DPMN_054041 [Dreissena polymorpha]
MGRWKSIRDSVYNAALSAFGKTEGKNPDRLNANLKEFALVFATEGSALLAYNKSHARKRSQL